MYGFRRSIMYGKSMKLLILVLAMAVSLFFGCGGDDETATTKQGGTESESEGKEPVHLTITHDPQWDTNLMDSEAFAIWNGLANEAGFDIEIISQPHSNYGEKLDVLFASGDVTDIVWDFALFDRYKSGLLVELDDLLAKDEYQGLVDMVPEKAWDLVKVGGSTYAVPTPLETLPRRGDMIRQDWLDNLGLDMPKNLEDIKHVFHEFTYSDPDGNGKDDTWAASFRKDLSWFDGFHGAFDLQSMYWPAYELPCDDVDGELVMQYTMQKYKDYLAFMRELWADGVFDPNAFLNVGSDFGDLWKTGQIGYIHHYAYNAKNNFTRLTQEISENPDAEFVAVLDGIEGPYGVGPTEDRPSGRYIMITEKCEDPEAALDYLNWAFTMPDERQEELVKWGVEGIHHKVIDGVKYRNPNTWTGSINEAAQLGDGDMFSDVKNPVPTRHARINMMGRFAGAIDPEDETWMKGMYGDYGLHVFQNLVTHPLDTKLCGKPELPGEEKIPEMNKIIIEHQTKIIMGYEELDAGFDKMVQELKNIGLDEMMAERQKWYDENKK